MAIDALNIWLGVPPTSTSTIKGVMKMLHSTSLMLDDIEDNSPLRRAKPSTHIIYGNAQTINSAKYQYTKQPVKQQACPTRSHSAFPSKKSSSSTSAKAATSTERTTPSAPQSPSTCACNKILDRALFPLSHLIGRFFQIRDDCQNLSSTVEADEAIASEMMALKAFLIKRKAYGGLSNEAKMEVLPIMKKTKNLEYTLSDLRALQEELETEVANFEGKCGEEN
ncbi:isoprenoid synthase domain-containing protein [Aspergillus similis]